VINIKVGLAAPRSQPSPHEKSSDQTCGPRYRSSASSRSKPAVFAASRSRQLAIARIRWDLTNASGRKPKTRCHRPSPVANTPASSHSLYDSG
jgi:hypothetical protein